MSNEIVKTDEVYDATFMNQLFKLAEALAKTQMIPRALWAKPYDVMAILLKGRELGMQPMAALSSLWMQDGKVQTTAVAIQGMVRNSSACKLLELKESTSKVCTYLYQRTNMAKPKEFSFTIEEAKAAGLIYTFKSGEPNNWMKWPRAMLRARCVTQLANAEFGDVLSGQVYDTDSAVTGEYEPRQEKANGSEPPADWPIGDAPLPEKTLPELLNEVKVTADWTPPQSGLVEPTNEAISEIEAEVGAGKYIDEIRTLIMEEKLKPKDIFGWIRDNVPSAERYAVKKALEDDK